MIIITVDSKIIGMGDEINRTLDDGTIFLSENLGYRVIGQNLYEIDSVPEEVEADKYCYTPEAGFYPNPEWEEPNKYGVPDETVQAIKDDTIMDLIELGVL